MDCTFSPSSEDVQEYEALKKELLTELRKGRVRDQTCPGHVGLLNQGATCYLNSLVQALFHIPAFREFTFQLDSSAKIISAVQSLFAHMQLSEDCAVSTKSLTSAFGWSNADVFEQHDAQELFVSMADAMSQESSDWDDFFTKQFKGSSSDVLECPSCGFKNTNTTPFQDIPLNLSQDSDSKGFVFTDLLAATTVPETLDDKNLWTCGGCSNAVAAKKSLSYNSLPPILICHLKRTSYDQVTQRRTKITAPVYFSKEIDGKVLKNDFAKTEKYKLKSILMHTGTASGGHYKAMVQENGVWYEYDDSIVTELSREEESKLFWYSDGDTEADDKASSSIYSSAYMLIYQLQDEKTVALEEATIDVPKELAEQVSKSNAKLHELKKAYKVHQLMTEVTTFKINADVGTHVKPSNIAPVPSINFMLGSCTLQNALETIRNSFVEKSIIGEDTTLARCRLRRFNSSTRMVGETFDGREGATLVDLGLFPLCSLALEVVAEGDAFTDFNPKEIEVRLVEWKEGQRSNDNAEDVFVLVSGEDKASVGALRSDAASELKVDASRIVLLRVPQASNVNYMALENDSMLLSDALVHSGDDICVHVLPEGVSFEGKGEEIISKIILEKRSICIMFNVPSSSNDDKECCYDKSVTVALDSTLGDLKGAIAKALSLSVDSFFLRRNANAPQLKALGKTLDVLNFVDQSIIHVDLGKQMAFGEFLMNLEADLTVEDGDWKVVPERKHLILGDIAVRSRMTINQLKEKIISDWSTLSGVVEGKLAPPKSIHHLRVKDGQSGVQSGPLRGDRVVSKCFLGLCDGRKIIVQVLEEEEIFEANQLYITNRVISYQKKIVSRPIGMQVSKECTVEELFKILLEKFPDLNEDAGEPDEEAKAVYGNLHQEFPESRRLAVAKAYNTGPPLSIKESLRLKWNDKSVVKDYKARIDKLPFNLRDGSVLVLRSVADFERAREAARARVAERPGSSSNFQGDSPARGRLRPGSRARSRSGSRGREKGIKINFEAENVDNGAAPNIPNPDGSGIASKSGNIDRKPMDLNEDMSSELPNAPVRMVKVLRSPRPGEEERQQ